MAKIALFADGFGGMTMACYTRLRDRGLDVVFRAPGGPEEMLAAYNEVRPDLVIAPTLTKRVPAELYGRVLINHPGQAGDRGPSSIDWARVRGERRAGHTLLWADDGWDAGPIAYTETFRYPDDERLTKSWVYSRIHRAATLRGIESFMDLIDRPATPLDMSQPGVLGTWNDPMKQSDCAVDWTHSAEEITRIVAARDGSPGVLVELLGVQAFIFDVHPGGPAPRGASPGDVVDWSPDGAVRVATGGFLDGFRESVWVGYIKSRRPRHESAFKLPAGWWVQQEAAMSLPNRWSTHRDPALGYRPVTVSYPSSDVAVVTAAAYNGAWSTQFCERVEAALGQVAKSKTVTTVIVRGGGRDSFGNGIHLNHIYGADPNLGNAMEREARANIRAINDVCARMFSLRRAGKQVVALVDGDAGAGGALMTLCADYVLADPGINLNYHYVGMGGLTGSEFHTWTLRQRLLSTEQREALLTECLPVSPHQATRMGLVDELAPSGLSGEDLGDWAVDVARRFSSLVAAGKVTPPPAPTEGEQIDTESDELKVIDEDFGDPVFQGALERFVRKLPGEPPIGPSAAGEYRGRYPEAVRG